MAIGAFLPNARPRGEQGLQMVNFQNERITECSRRTVRLRLPNTACQSSAAVWRGDQAFRRAVRIAKPQDQSRQMRGSAG
jgi:hypothetical protein